MASTTTRRLWGREQRMEESARGEEEAAQKLSSMYQSGEETDPTKTGIVNCANTMRGQRTKPSSLTATQWSAELRCYCTPNQLRVQSGSPSSAAALLFRPPKRPGSRTPEVGPPQSCGIPFPGGCHVFEQCSRIPATEDSSTDPQPIGVVESCCPSRELYLTAVIRTGKNIS